MKKREELILFIEDTTTKLKLLIHNGIISSTAQLTILAQCNALISEAEKELRKQTDDKEFIDEQIKGLNQLLNHWMNTYLLGLTRIAKENKSGLLGDILKNYSLLDKNNVEAKPIKNGGLTIVGSDKDLFLANQGITNIRELMTNPQEGGVGRYVDYGKKIRDEISNLQQQYAVDPAAFTDSKGNKKNLRAMAEIKVRYDMISDDLKGNVEYVCASSHPNASERCSWWQGKVFKVDIDVATRNMYQFDEAKTKSLCKPLPKEEWKDGIPTYSLKTAIECGFLSYNCQHRLIKYYKGVKAPQYDFITVEKKRNLTTYQRALENKVRQTKMLEKVNGRNFPIERKNLFTGEMEKMTAVEYSKMLQDKYEEFCKKNGLVQYTWRLRITDEERGIKIPTTTPNASNQAKIVIQPLVKMSNEDLTTQFEKHFSGDTAIIKDFVSKANVKDDNVYKILAHSNKLEKINIEKGKPAYKPGLGNSISLLSKKDVNTSYHEFGHSLDHLVAKDMKWDKENSDFHWISDDIENVRTEAKASMNNTIPSSLIEELDKTKNEVKASVLKDVPKIKEKIIKNVAKTYKNRLPESMLKPIVERELEKEITKSFNNYANNNLDYTKWSCLSDIYDAITDGGATNARQLTGYHGRAYYLDFSIIRVNTAGKVKKQNTEIFANFCEMKFGNYEKQLEFLQKDQPKLYDKLEERFNFVAQYLEDKK